jgi:lipopolysaccharide biosynthesis glycosyltransferase
LRSEPIKNAESSSENMQNVPSLVNPVSTDSVIKQSGVVGLGDVCIVFAADENYAMPLATAIRSLVEANREVAQTAIYVLSNGVSERTRQKITDSLEGFDTRLHWLPIDLSTYSGFATPDYASKMTFARLKIPELIPAHIKRALYIDSDVLILGEITELLLADLQGAPLGAVLDAIDWNRAPGSIRIRDVPAVESYFNAGVLLIDLAHWTQSGVSERAYRFLEQNPATPFADQDALNVACDGSWTMLDDRWNFQRSRDHLIGETDAAIVHFVTWDKPWNPNTRNRNAALYDRFRSRTQFARSRIRRNQDHFLRACSMLKRFIKIRAGTHTGSGCG